MTVHTGQQRNLPQHSSLTLPYTAMTRIVFKTGMRKLSVLLNASVSVNILSVATQIGRSTFHSSGSSSAQNTKVESNVAPNEKINTAAQPSRLFLLISPNPFTANFRFP
mmetsp:Transcript_25558/g.37145  ORF Transcript_25558/g.37145 Transcript_25558/m.37145 type:complete len:109 (+) Transcript_25558:122-448(+)